LDCIIRKYCIIFIEKLPEKYKLATEEDFKKCKTLNEAFSTLTTKIRPILKNGNFRDIRRSCFEQFNPASGCKLPEEQIKEIKDCKNVDDLFDVLAMTPYWCSLDIRVLEGMAAASDQEDAVATIELYRRVIYPQKFFEFDLCFSAEENNAGYGNNEFYTTIKEKYNIDPKTVTVEDLVKHRSHAERRRMCLDMLAFANIDPGSLVIYWLIPKVTAYYAYYSIKKSCYLSDSIVSFEINGYPLIECAAESAMTLEKHLLQELLPRKRNINYMHLVCKSMQLHVNTYNSTGFIGTQLIQLLCLFSIAVWPPKLTILCIVFIKL